MPKIRAAARAAGVPAFEVFGEVFETDAATLASFVRERGVPNVIDFPLQDALVRYAGGSAGARGIATRLGDDDYFRLGNGVAPAPVTFLGNHDVGRAALKIKEQGGAEGAELLARDLLGHSLLYLLRGAPAVYYGDEVGHARVAAATRRPVRISSRRASRSGRRRSAWALRRSAAGSSFDLVAHPVSEHLRALGALRDAHPALSTGASFVRVAREGDARREPDRPRRAAASTLRRSTQSEEPATVTVQTATPSSSWSALMGLGAIRNREPRERPDDCFASLRSRPSLFRAEVELPRRGAARLTVRVAPDRFTNLVRIGATATSVDPLSVTFAVKRPGKRWARIGTDDGAPYGVFVDPRDYRRGQSVSFVAVARASDGSVSTSPVVTVRLR